MSTTRSTERAQYKGGPKLSELQRRAIVAAVSSGLPQATVAQQFGVHRNTVSTIYRDVVNSVPQMRKEDWRTSQAQKAVIAVNSGLDCDDDPYKRATIGVSVLKGLGEYAADNQTQVAVVYGNMPASVESVFDSIEIDAITETPASPEA